MVGAPPNLGELLAVLALGIDLAHGQAEHLLRQWVISLELADRLALKGPETEVLSFITLMGYVGCHADSHEQVRWFGDDIRWREDVYSVDLTPRNRAPFVLARVGADRPRLERARAFGAFLARGHLDAEAMDGNHCAIAIDFAVRLGLPEPVRAALRELFERWDGHGDPGDLAGDDICVPVRIHALADGLVFHHRRGGLRAAVELARARRGTEFDPHLVDVFCDEARYVLAPLEADLSWAPLIARQPRLAQPLTATDATAAIEAIADYADLKSPHTLGHSRAVADLAAAAGRENGMPEDQVDDLRTAALLHDLGRLGVSNAIWEKPQRLSAAERERVRLYPYLTERMVSASPTLKPLAGLAASSQERLDGSGYPHGLRRDALSPAACILAAADIYRALQEPRAHRAAVGTTAAANHLRDEVRAGRVDGPAVEAVLGAAGHRSARRPEHPGGLTARELEVLRLLARGLQTKQIAAELQITPKTVGHHIQHIYGKIGASNRVRASLFATEHGLV
jgi:HD-GYP domain-containing protein (c-di-GMP phosphodiesterase class II)